MFVATTIQPGHLQAGGTSAASFPPESILYFVSLLSFLLSFLLSHYKSASFCNSPGFLVPIWSNICSNCWEKNFWEDFSLCITSAPASHEELLAQYMPGCIQVLLDRCLMSWTAHWISSSFDILMGHTQLSMSSSPGERRSANKLQKLHSRSHHSWFTEMGV